jgi:hypothetical protein
LPVHWRLAPARHLRLYPINFKRMPHQLEAFRFAACPWRPPLPITGPTRSPQQHPFMEGTYITIPFPFPSHSCFLLLSPRFPYHKHPVFDSQSIPMPVPVPPAPRALAPALRPLAPSAPALRPLAPNAPAPAPAPAPASVPAPALGAPAPASVPSSRKRAATTVLESEHCNGCRTRRPLADFVNDRRPDRQHKTCKTCRVCGCSVFLCLLC